MNRSSSPWRGQHETARQFAAPVGFEIELRHQIVHRETMHPAQHALGEIARLARTIELEYCAPPSPRASRAAGPSHTRCVWSAPPDRRCPRSPSLSRRLRRGRPSAARDERCSRARCSREGGATRRDRRAGQNPCAARGRAKTLRELHPRRRRARLAQGTSLSRTLRAARSALPIRDRTPGPLRRSRRRLGRFCLGRQIPRAPRSVRRAASARGPSRGNDRDSTASQSRAAHCSGVLQTRPAQSAYCRRRAVQRAIRTRSGAIHSRSPAKCRCSDFPLFHWLNRSEDPRPLKHRFKHTSARHAREPRCSGLSREGRAAVARDIRRAVLRYRRQS